MNTQTVLTLAQKALEVMLMVSGPLLLVALSLGLLISLLQAATQINEMTLSFIPKILGVFAVLMILGPWMLVTLVDYTTRLITNIPFLIG